MVKLNILFKYIAPFLFAGGTLFGCAAPDAIVSHKKEPTAEELMREGMYYFERGYYQSAQDDFQKLVDRYPYSIHSTEAELKLADSLYYNKKYDEAIDIYNEFQRLHPKNKNIPYIIYQKGMCYFSQISTVDRDQSNTVKAKESFERLVEKYPQSEYAEQARWRIRDCYVSLSNSELYVAHFYYKMKQYKAAEKRYLYILENYPDLGQYHEAVDSLRKCREKIAEIQSEMQY